ncbi:uncharacterized protein LOC128645029 [Bombina bombina]|uniref:uncharacterized protein LOC128645029 n=1 Tax=Bombina bombina TaxID=8345 RepID=UPI00235A61CD|nr:uncharacterized protein LOC128645029 [Bombina bombina]
MESERKEEFPLSSHKSSILGDSYRFCRDEDLPDRRQVNKTSKCMPRPSFHSTPVSSSMHGGDRLNGSGNGHSTFCTPTPQTAAIMHAKSVEWGLLRFVPYSESESRDQKFSSMVALSATPVQGDAIQQARLDNCNNRRQPTRLGRCLEFSEGSGTMESGGESPSNKHSGIESSSQCPSGLAPVNNSGVHQVSVGQHHDCSLHQPSGRDKKLPSNDGSIKDNSLGRVSLLPPVSNPHPGSGELGGGFLESPDSSSGGVGTSSGGLCPNTSTLGQTRDRSHGVSPERQTSSLRVQIQGSGSSSDRCFDSTLELQDGLCVSTLPAASSIDCQNQTGESISNSNSTCLATQDLVCRSSGHVILSALVSTSKTGPSDTGSIQTSKSNFSEADCLEIERLILSKRGFSESVIDTLIQARKPVTRRIYHKIWRKYLYWCESKGYSWSKVRIARILSFLQEGLEKGLSASSLKGQISALSILLHRRLSENPDVQSFCQALARIKPVFKAVAPPWSLNLVLNVLQGVPFEPLHSIDIKMLSWKVLFLMAISSARRVSELSALHCDSPYLIFHSDKVVLRTKPGFLPKVVTNRNINQEIVVPSLCPNPSSKKERLLHNLDVVRALKFYLQATKDFRQTSSLFVVYSGQRRGQKASATSLSFWLRSIIRLAYETAGQQPPERITAHSTRAVASTWAFKNEASVEQICKAATWSSLHTFSKFYKFDTFASSEAIFGRKVLQAVVPSV